MQLSKEEYARKRIHNGSSVQIENSVTRVTARHDEARTVTFVTVFSISTSQPLKILIICTMMKTGNIKGSPHMHLTQAAVTINKF